MGMILLFGGLSAFIGQNIINQDIFACTSTPVTKNSRAFGSSQNKTIKNIIKIVFMKTIDKRKTASGPCKSPSPDFYNRSIIKGTTIEVENIRTKMKQAEEKHRRYELESSYSQNLPSELNTSFENKYRQLCEELNRLKNENRYLAEQNLLLNQENKRFALYDERSKTISQLTGALLSKNEKEPLRERLISLDQDRTRLQTELLAIKTKNQQSQRLIQNLRNELEQARQQISRFDSQSGLHNSLNNHESRLTFLSNTIINSFNETFQSKIEHLNARINKVELMQKIIKEQHSRLIAQSRIQRTPVSYKKQERDTLSTSFKNYQEEPSSLCKLSRSIYPYNINQQSFQRLEEENSSLIEVINRKENEIAALKQENQRVTSTLKKLQREKGKIKLTPPKSKEKQDNQEVKKINQYREQLQTIMKERNDLNDRLLEEQSKYESQKQGLMETIQRLHRQKISCEIKQSQNQRLNLEKHQQIASLQIFNKELTNLQEELNIKQLLPMLSENFQIFDKMQHSLEISKHSYLQQLEGLRERLLAMEEQNYRLQTGLGLKTKEVQLLTLQLEKLRKLNGDFAKQQNKQHNSDEIVGLTSNIFGGNAKFKLNHDHITGTLSDSYEKFKQIYSKIQQKTEYGLFSQKNQ